MLADSDTTQSPTPTALELVTHGVSGTPTADMLGIPQAKVCTVTHYPGRYAGTFSASSDDVASSGDVAADVPCRVGYRWGAMTAGTRKQLLWVVFIPFALVNVAWWMLPERGRAAGRVDVLRALYRLLGLILTAMVAVQIMVIVADVVMSQYLPAHRDRLPGWLSLTVAQQIATALVAVVAVLLFNWLAKLKTDDDVTDGTMPDDVPEPTRTDGLSGLATDDFMVCTDSTAPALLTAHGLVVYGIATCYCAGWPFVDTGSAANIGCGIAGAVTVAIAVIIGLVTTDPRGRGNGTVNRYLKHGWGRAWVVAAFVLFVVTIVTAYPATVVHVPLVSLRMLLVVGGGFLVVVLVATVMLALTPRTLTEMDGYRPWLFGMHSACVALIAGVVGASAGMALAQFARALFGGFKWSSIAKPNEWWTFLRDSTNDSIRLPWIYDLLARVWGVAIVALVVVGGIWYLGANSALKSRIAQAENRQRAGVPSWDAAMSKAVRSKWKVAGYKLRVPDALFVIAVAVVGAGLAVTACQFFDARLWDWLQSILGLVELVGLVAVVVGFGLLIGIVINAGRAGEAVRRRSLGVLWDLASFWPREAHPIVPPSYAPRALRDITRFVKEKVPPEQPARRVILCGHSQGSVLMYAAAHRLAAAGFNVSLLTYGSQLRWAYGRAFPGYLNIGTHASLLKAIDGRWINMVRHTDYIGDSVLSRDCECGEWRFVDYGGDVPVWGVGVLTERTPGDDGAQLSPPRSWRGALVKLSGANPPLPAELWLLDPVGDPYGGGQELRQHSHYTRNDSGPPDTDEIWEWCIEQLS